MPKEYLKLLGKLNVVSLTKCEKEKCYISIVQPRERSRTMFFIHNTIDYKSPEPLSGRSFSMIYRFYVHHREPPLSYVCH